MEEQKILREELKKKEEMLQLKEQQISVQEHQIQALGTANTKLITKLTELRDRFSHENTKEHRASSC